jgi:hypothetical protein
MAHRLPLRQRATDGPGRSEKPLILLRSGDRAVIRRRADLRRASPPAAATDSPQYRLYINLQINPVEKGGEPPPLGRRTRLAHRVLWGEARQRAARPPTLPNGGSGPAAVPKAGSGPRCLRRGPSQPSRLRGDAQAGGGLGYPRLPWRGGQPGAPTPGRRRPLSGSGLLQSPGKPSPLSTPSLGITKTSYGC